MPGPMSIDYPTSYKSPNSGDTPTSYNIPTSYGGPTSKDGSTGSPRAGSGTPGTGSGRPDSGTPRTGKDGDGPEIYKSPVISEGDAPSSKNQQGTGTAGTSTSLCARNKSACDDMKDVAQELVGQIIGAVPDAAEPENRSAGVEPTVTATAVIAVTASRNGTTIAPRMTPMPNLNMSSWMDLYDYRDLFTAEEYSMLQDDPLCFYANFGRLYETYASASRTNSTITTAPANGTVQPRPSVAVNFSLGRRYAIGSLDFIKDEAKTLYLSYLPDQLRLVYASTPTSLSVTATATTTCSGLSGLGISDFETPYAMFGYRDGNGNRYAPSETAASTTEVTGGGTSEVTSAGTPEVTCGGGTPREAGVDAFDRISDAGTFVAYKIDMKEAGEGDREQLYNGYPKGTQ